MDFLDPRRVIRRHDQRDVRELFDLAARLPQEADDLHAVPLRGLGRADHVGALAARGVQGQHVARPRQGFDLTGEHLVEAHVVRARGEQRGVGGESHRPERGPRGPIADHVFRRQVLRVGRAAAVAREEQGSPGAQRRRVRIRDRRDRLRVGLRHAGRQRREGGEPRARVLRRRHPVTARTIAGRSAPRSSSAVPTTTKSAPAPRAART